MSWEFERVSGPRDATEGPVWMDWVVRFTEIRRNQLLEYDPETDATRVYIDETAGAVGLHEGLDGTLYACEAEGHRIAALSPEGATTVVVDEFEGTPLNGPNDLEIDGKGDIWFTDPDDIGRGELGHTSVYRAERGDSGWELVHLTDEMDRPNGLLLSPDESKLYVAECTYGPDQDCDLRAYEISADGSLGEYEVLHDFGDHRGIDGMTLTEEGAIVACAGWEESGPGPSVYVFSPAGELLARHPFPENRPTNCTFGGPDRSTLYVADLTGSLHSAETELTGFDRF
ncbi:SMP-30/gluconolactonase/LRE family protein [Halorarum halophilum]|uniref:SMP-30/gluconolactonase/LRE family protein n=1 Tax=Halorarum halophilum TaxID=2743090 RepID=A0A7D5KNW4_9EURY|nr:SMP-30/gluconolactonase/LRE family protein [Halobaculum halophilum]QLG28862.1 SMP-30/gluconolactonase/LRE family protein [Halobaculum halophilum]